MVDLHDPGTWPKDPVRGIIIVPWPIKDHGAMASALQVYRVFLGQDFKILNDRYALWVTKDIKLLGLIRWLELTESLVPPKYE